MTQSIYSSPDIDTDLLHQAIQNEYQMVAENPDQGFHFHTGRPLTRILRYEDEWLKNVPESSIQSFAGTGNPFFTTDSAAALRAAEMSCDALLKGTQVDGVYSADPKTNPEATKYVKLDYQTVLTNNLRVMDTTAIALAREIDIPIVVFSIHEHREFARVICGKGGFTIISKE